MATLHFLMCVWKLFEIWPIAQTKTIIIRHPISVSGSPIGLLLSDSRHDWPEMSRDINLITGRGSHSLPPTTVCSTNGSSAVRAGSIGQQWCKRSLKLHNYHQCYYSYYHNFFCCLVFIVYTITLTNWYRVTHICWLIVICTLGIQISA